MEAVVAQTRTVVLLGEGNFSYALARIRLHLSKASARSSPQRLHMIATSFDSETELFSKYPESVQIIQKMHSLQAKEELLSLSVVHQVDATRIKETLSLAQELQGSVDEVTFCHPHIGSEDLRRNSALVAHFFHSAKTSFPVAPRLLQITLLQSQYERWQISKLERLNALQLLGSHTIDPSLFAHGYETRRHQSGKSFSTSKVGKNFTIQSMAYLYSLTPAEPLQSEFILDSGVAPFMEAIEQEESKTTQTKQTTSSEFLCDLCQKLFSSERALKNHQKNRHEEAKSSAEKRQASEKLYCPHCDRDFNSDESLNQHIKSKHEKGGEASMSADHTGIRLEICDEQNLEDNCSVCGQAAHSADFLQPPVQLSLQCSYCQRSFINQRALSQHQSLSCKSRPIQTNQL